MKRIIEEYGLIVVLILVIFLVWGFAVPTYKIVAEDIQVVANKITDSMDGETGSEEGVESEFVPGLYETGAIDFYNTYGPDGPSLNEYGFYFGVKYSITDGSHVMFYVFYEDGSFEGYLNGSIFVSAPAGTVSYAFGALNINGTTISVSADGTQLISTEDGMVLTAEVPATKISDMLIYSWDELENEGYLIDVNGDLRITTKTKELAGDLIMPEHIAVIDKYFFNWGAELTGIKALGSITSLGEGAFNGCSSLITVDLNFENIAGIDDYTFNGCTSLVEFKIPEGCTFVGKNAFKNCTGLEKIYIPDSVRDFLVFSFLGCENLTDVYYEGTEEQWNTQISFDTTYMGNPLYYGATLHCNYVAE